MGMHCLLFGSGKEGQSWAPAWPPGLGGLEALGGMEAAPVSVLSPLSG